MQKRDKMSFFDFDTRQKKRKLASEETLLAVLKIAQSTWEETFQRKQTIQKMKK